MASSVKSNFQMLQRLEERSLKQNERYGSSPFILRRRRPSSFVEKLKKCSALNSFAKFDANTFIVTYIE
ncbi:hypothetical protein EON65_50445 [archaeon]|nr:MAG: hypothetical protein EON65_50445 [archaeon]